MATKNWQTSFAGYATSVAFGLTLSGPMVMVLQQVAFDGCTHGRHVNLHGATVAGLEHRGLIEMTTLKHGALGTLRTIAWKLTPAGEHVYDLCVLAGLVRDVDHAKDEASQ